MINFYFINGEYKRLEDPSIAPNDIGLLRGYGIFEVFRTYNGKLFYFKEHMDRLFNSADNLGIEIPYDTEEIKKIISNLKEKNNLKETFVRVIVTGGKSPHGMDFSAAESTFIILLEHHDPLPQDYYDNGVELLTLEHKRIIPESKITNYILAISKRKELKEKNKFDFLYTWKGCVLESVTSNLFLVKNGRLITPEEKVLGGVTRKAVIDLAEEKFNIEKRPIKVEELKEVDEAFLTATNKEVLPVTMVDDLKIGDGKVGKATEEIKHLFKKMKENF